MGSVVARITSRPLYRALLAAGRTVREPTVPSVHIPGPSRPSAGSESCTQTWGQNMKFMAPSTVPMAHLTRLVTASMRDPPVAVLRSIVPLWSVRSRDA